LWITHDKLNLAGTDIPKRGAGENWTRDTQKRITYKEGKNK